MSSIDVLIDIKNQLGEGPLWDVEEQRLYWVDGFGMLVFRATADGREVRAWEVPQPVGCLALRKSGGAVLALQNGFHFLDFTTGEVTSIGDPEADRPDNRFNDGKVDRRGRFVAGSLNMKRDGKFAALYRLDPDLTIHRLQEGIACTNGPCWSPDGCAFYFSDSGSGEIWAYDYDIESGRIANRRRFAQASTPDGGIPDGSTVDEEGFLWSAQIFGGRLIRYAPDGSIDRVVEMPVKNVTSVMFGGPDLDILYVTSMARRHAHHLPADTVHRGSVFTVRGLGVRGLPETRFAG